MMILTCISLSISHLDIISNLLCQHINSALRMSWLRERERARIHHSQPLHTLDPRLRVHHRSSLITASPLASRGRMSNGERLLLDPTPDLVIALRPRPRLELISHDNITHLCPDLAQPLESRDCLVFFPGIREPARADDWRKRGVQRRDSEAAT